jgi:AcrR family transcriptional regulator
VFAERGVFGGTVEDICARAGFTRGAFYSNFADKDDVLRALVSREHDRLLAYLDTGLGMVGEAAAAASGSDADPEATMAAIADGLLRSVPLDRQFFLVRAELELHALRDPAVAGLLRDADAGFRERIAAFLEQGLRALGRELVVDARDASDVATAIVQLSLRRALLEGGGTASSRGDAAGADPSGLARTMLPAIMVGLTRPGRTS